MSGNDGTDEKVTSLIDRLPHGSGHKLDPDMQEYLVNERTKLVLNDLESWIRLNMLNPNARGVSPAQLKDAFFFRRIASLELAIEQIERSGAFAPPIIEG